jgi:hypothetical protein
MGNWHVNRTEYYMSLLVSVHVTCARSSNYILKCQNYSPQCLRTKKEILKWKLRILRVSFLKWKELSVTRLFLLNKANPAIYFKVFGCLHQWIFENNQICDWKSGLHIIMYIPTPHFLVQQLWTNAYTMLEHHCPVFIFRRLCISLQFFANDQLEALFYILIYYTSLHVSSITVPIIRRSNCINTSSGMISLCKWLLGMLVRRKLQFPPDRHTKQSLTHTNHTRWCINTIRSPDDEHRDAWNM